MSAYLWRSKVKMKIDCNIKSNIVKLPKTNLSFRVRSIGKDNWVYLVIILARSWAAETYVLSLRGSDELFKQNRKITLKV